MTLFIQLLMVFLLNGRHLLQVFVLVRISQRLRGYAQIACKKQEEFWVKVNLLAKRIQPLLPPQGKEKVEGFPLRRTKAKDLIQIDKGSSQTCQRLNASTVRSLATSLEIVSRNAKGSEGDNMHLQLIQMTSLKRRRERNPILQGRQKEYYLISTL